MQAEQENEERKMKKTILTMAILLGLGAGNPAMAEPYAPLLPLNEQGKQMMKATGKTEAQRVGEAPSRDEIDIPAYPGAYMSMSGKSNGVLSSVQLVSGDAPEKVVAWYRDMLTAMGWQSRPSLATKLLDEVAVFIETTRADIGMIDAMKYRQVRIRKINNAQDDLPFEAMVSDVSGVKSVISIQVKPAM